jgi:glycosyltransferase A (GT-A) superfamily protein (DUF2064 family)
VSAALVLAKAPVVGRAKTRLGRDVGMVVAAELAAAALLDTLEACASAFGPDNCHLSLDGDLAAAARSRELRDSLRGWTVRAQYGDSFADRIARAHLEVSDVSAGPVVQLGMDTPQATPELLREAAAATTSYDAVLGPAEDGGWWVLAQRDPAVAAALRDVPMSSVETYDRTRAAIVDAGLSVGAAQSLRDVDRAVDAAAVAALAPETRFARSWRALVEDG